MSWFHNGQLLLELPDDCVGFVYLITNLHTNQKYIGKKLAEFSKTTYKTVTLKNGTKKKKKIKSKVASDWETYYGSSEALNKDLEAIGKQWFRRDILHICKSKAACSYLEAKEQFSRGVLESKDYYNNQISVRVHGNHIFGKL
jgi:hypothetical protein